MTSAEGVSNETILRVATELFAALGYDGTSTQQIADAVGLDVATVNHTTGGKRDLYLAVMDRAHFAEHSALEQAITKAGRAGLATLIHEILDGYLDFSVANPDVVSLWMHRWLSDAADVTELEQRYARPLVMMIVDAFGPYQDEIDDSIDLRFVAQSIIWCVNAFGRGGVVDEEGRRRSFDDPEVLRRFRAHLHQMMHRTLLLP